jgi:hypothetical protein
MSKEYNGVTFFAPGEKDMNHPAFKELNKVSLGDVRFPFGLFLVEEGGKTVVIPATEQDRRKILLKAFPHLKLQDIPPACDLEGGDRCFGACPQHFPAHFKCLKMFDPRERFFGCACVDIS